MTVLLFLAACAGGDAPDVVATSASSDVALLMRTATGLGQGIGDLGLEGSLAEGTFEGVGTCAWAWEVSGNPMSGTLMAAPELTPCGGAYAGSSGGGTYDVVSGSLSGTYTGDHGDWDLSVDGDRAAELTVATERRDRTWDSSWTLNALEAHTDGTHVDDFSIDLDYVGFRDRGWHLSVSGSEEEVTGTLTGDDGSCTLTGTPSAAYVECE